MKLNASVTDITIIIICLVTLELVFRISAPLFSGHVKQIYEIPGIAQELSQNKPAILFLGNSLIGNAIDLKSFNKQADLKMTSYMVVPDGTSLWDWFCIVKNDFINKKRLPETIIMGYAWQQAAPVPERLGGFFCSIKDLPELIHKGMSNNSDIIEFLVSKLSKLYAMHETVRKRILDLIIPGYQIHTQAINLENNKNQPAVDKENVQEDYRLLSAYMKMLVDNNIRPVIVAMPVKQSYILGEEFFRVVSSNGGLVLDYRELDGLGESMFRDPIHLNERGNEFFTNHLASDMKNM
jgi:hypothetical protein